MSFDPFCKLPVVVFFADEPGGVDVLDRNVCPPGPLEGESLFVVSGDDNEVLGYASSKACRFVPEPEANTAKREPSGSRSDKLYAPGLCDLPDPPRIATRPEQRLEPRLCLFGRHDRTETDAQVENPAHLGFGQAA